MRTSLKNLELCTLLLYHSAPLFGSALHLGSSEITILAVPGAQGGIAAKFYGRTLIVQAFAHKCPGESKSKSKVATASSHECRLTRPLATDALSFLRYLAPL